MPPSPFLALDLPPPDARDACDSRALAAQIRAHCAAAGGVIGFDAFMDRALYTSGLGYYAAARSRFGARGDFVTAPEISPRFARCVARQTVQILDAIGGGEVLEVGAGSGTLAAGVLAALDTLGHAGARYLILERSAGGRGFQRERLAPFGDRVHWLDDLPPPGWRGVVLANELLDALPARCFILDHGSPRELGVAAAERGFGWHAMAPDAATRAVLDDLLHGRVGELAHGYRGEFAPLRGAFVREIAARLAAGALLLIDYGYPRRELYHPQRGEGTLACHYRHRVHGDPFWWPGLQDISVHVDFTAIAEAGTHAGLQLAGYTTQAHFLLATGLLDGVDDADLDVAARARLSGEIRRLILPGELGEAVKVMALTREVPCALGGFQGHDLSHRL